MSKSEGKYDPQSTYQEDLEAASESSELCCFGQRRRKQESRVLLRQNDEIGNLKDCWLVSELKNLKECFLEAVGGPKCKNLAKKAGAYCKWRRSSRTKIEFLYSPESYALNFDDGDDDLREEKDLLDSL